MSRTKAQVVAAVLQDLQAIDSAGTVEAEDETTVGTRFDTGVATLASRDVIYLSEDTIPDEAFDPFVAYLVETCGPSFGRERNAANIILAEDQLRSVSSKRPTYRTLKPSFI